MSDLQEMFYGSSEIMLLKSLHKSHLVQWMVKNT